MPTIVELIASIRADGAAATAADLQKVGKTGKQAGKEVVAATDSMQKGALAVAKSAAKMFVAYKGADILVGLVTQSTQLAARYETLGTVMHTVTGNMGLNAQSADYLADSVRKMGISLTQSRNTVIQMAQSQLDLSKASELARVSQDAAVLAGVDSSEALGRIVYGIKTAQSETLRTVGLNVNFERSYQKLALQLDKNVSSLSEGEKAQARMNAVMEEGRRVTGSYEAAMTTAGKKVTSLARQQEDLMVRLGALFTPAYALIIDEITDSLKGMNSELADASESGGFKGLQDQISGLTALAITAGKGVGAAFTVPADAAMSAYAAFGHLLAGDVAGSFEILKKGGQDMIDTLMNVTSAYQSMEDIANTFTFAIPAGVDEFGVQQFKIVTETFEDLDDASRAVFKNISEGQMKMKADADGVRSAITTLDDELTTSLTGQLAAARERNATIGAESEYQKTIAELEKGKLKNINEFLALDKEKLALNVASLDQAIAYYAANKAIEGSEEAIVTLTEQRAKTMAQIALLQDGFVKGLKDQLLAEAKKYDVAQAAKQIREKQFQITLIGKERSEAAALNAEHQLAVKGLKAQGREMAELVRLEYRRNAEVETADRVRDIAREIDLIGKGARAHEVATAAVDLHKAGYHDLARAIEEVTADLYDMNQAFALESAADPSIQRNIAMEQLNRLLEQGLISAKAYRAEEEKITGAYINQKAALGELSAAEQQHFDVLRAKNELESAKNQTAFDNRNQTRIQQMIHEDEITEQLIKDQEQLIATLKAKDDVNEEVVTNAEIQLERLKQQSNQFGKTIRDIGENSLGNFFYDIMRNTESVADAFDNMVNSIVQSMQRIAAEQLAQMATGGIESLLTSVASSYFGSAGTTSTGTGFTGTQLHASAKGNVMTEHGPMKLQKYSSGGIARSPQLSLFGEGSQPEAYVPLPDGRTIPVTMKEDKKQGEVDQRPITVNVQVTSDVSPKSATQTGYRIGRAIGSAQRRNA